MTAAIFSTAIVYMLASVRRHRIRNLSHRRRVSDRGRCARNRIADLRARAVVEAAGVQAPRFEVDPMWPKPLPNHWIMGNMIGVSVDARTTSGSFTAPAPLEAQGNLRHHQSPRPPIAARRAAGARIRRSRQSDRPLGRSRPGLRLARLEPRHHRRLQRQRVDRRQRPRPAAPGDAPVEGQCAAAAPFNDNMILKFTQDGKFLMQIGKPGQSKGSNDIENLKGAGEDVRRSEDQRTVRRRRLRQPSRDRVRRRHRQVQAALGRLRPQARRHQSRAATIPMLRPRSSSAIRCIAPSSRTTACSMSATASNDRIQVFKPDGTFVKEDVHREEHAGRRLGVGHRLLEGPAAEVHLPGRRREREDPHHRCATRWRS